MMFESFLFFILFYKCWFSKKIDAQNRFFVFLFIVCYKLVFTFVQLSAFSLRSAAEGCRPKAAAAAAVCCCSCSSPRCCYCDCSCRRFFAPRIGAWKGFVGGASNEAVDSSAGRRLAMHQRTDASWCLARQPATACRRSPTYNGLLLASSSGSSSSS